MEHSPTTSGSRIDSATENSIREFARVVVPRLSDLFKGQVSDWDARVEWESGADGHFRPHPKRTRSLWRTLNEDWLYAQPEFEAVARRLKDDAIVGKHIERLVGTKTSANRVEVENILLSVIYAMLDDEGDLKFTDKVFDREWSEIATFLCSDQILLVTIAVLPNLAVSQLPLRLNAELVLDHLTSAEVTRCCDVGVLRPNSIRYPMLGSEVAVGIRKSISLPKVILKGDEPHVPLVATDEGTFGHRPVLLDHLVVDDVLSALRLFKHTQIRTAGFASWSDSIWLRSGTSYRAMGQWPYGGVFELSDGEVPRFLELWQLLEQGASRFGFSIHRFNLAFERGLLADRIVDLVIASESLFLGDQNEKYRGELSYRCALRAAKFIRHPTYNERDVFRIMRSAYDARSTIVHGGKVKDKDTRLPHDESGNLSTFIDAIEELVRLSLHKALAMGDDGGRLRESQFWDEIIFP